MQDLDLLPVYSPRHGSYGVRDPLHAWDGAGADVMVVSFLVGQAHYQVGWTQDRPDPVYFRQRPEAGAWTAWQTMGGMVVPGGDRHFTFASTPAPPPVSGQIRMNQAAQDAVDTLWVSDTDADGNDVASALDAVAVGQTIHIEDKQDAGIRQDYRASGPSQPGAGFHTIPVTWVEGSGLLDAGGVVVKVQ